MEPETTKVVQQVSKASSDELLRKFAETVSDSENEASSARKKKKFAKRRKIRWRNDIATGVDSNHHSPVLSSRSGCQMVERKSLLSPPSAVGKLNGGGKQRSVLKRLGIGRYGARKNHHHHAKNRSVLGAIEKTWSKAVRGASRVFMEKQFNHHRRLISDVVV